MHIPYTLEGMVARLGWDLIWMFPFVNHVVVFWCMNEKNLVRNRKGGVGEDVGSSGVLILKSFNLGCTL